MGTDISDCAEAEFTRLVCQVIGWKGKESNELKTTSRFKMCLVGRIMVPALGRHVEFKKRGGFGTGLGKEGRILILDVLKLRCL